MIEQAENLESGKRFSQVIKIKGINQSGIVMDTVTIPAKQGDLYVIGFDIRSGNEVLIVTQSFDWESEQGMLYYLSYDFDGNLLFQKELLQSGTEWIAQEVHFDKNGSIAVIGLNSRFEGKVIFWDDNLSYIGEKPVISDVFTFTRDGTYICLVNENVPILEKVNLFTGELIQKIPLPHPDITSIHLAEENSLYDIYFVTTQHLYGYNIKTGTREHILSFFESQISISTFSHIAFTADGCIVISQERPNLETNSWYVELVVLSPVQRSVLADRNYIILAGFRLRSRFADEVMYFNRKSSEVQIILHDYWDINDDLGFKQAIERFNLDIIAGNVPDIILFEHPDDFSLARTRETLVRQGVLIDLYSFIDSDPDLNREDFFQNILHGFEDADGMLPVIGNWLTITTMIALPTTIQTGNWEFDDFLTMMELSVAAGIIEPLGNRITSTLFLTTVLEYIENDFVDLSTGISRFESESFIRLLKLAASIPTNQEYVDWGIGFFPNFDALVNGEQMVDIVGFGGYYGLSNISGGADTGVPPFTYIGFPGISGGVHNVQIWGTLSIFANSQHTEAAWKFVRETLLPGATENIALTIRKDEFESRVATSTMTDQEKDQMREIMNQVIVNRPISGTIIMIVEEEFISFYRGHRTAEDAARIIQNRVQTYLNERS
jgi:hypothetical protein